MRTKNSLLNSIISFTIQFVIIIFSFLTRKSFIVHLGNEYLGFDGLFSNVISIMTIVDMGLLSAMYFALYKPIADNDIELINQIVTYFKKIFYSIGILLMILSLVILPFLPFFTTQVLQNQLYISIVFLLYATNVFIRYFFCHYNAILFTNQEEFKIVLFSSVARIIFKLIQIIVLPIYSSYILYLTIEFIISLISKLLLACYVRKKYKNLLVYNKNLSTQKKKTIFSNVKYLGLSKLSEIGKSSTDSIIITKFVGIQAMGVFSNYQLVLLSAYGLMENINNGVISSLGNLVVENNFEKINNTLKKYLFLTFFVSSIYLVVASNLIQPFISIFFGNIYLVDFNIVLIVVFNHYIMLLFAAFENYLNVIGKFKEVLPSKIIQMIINLFISVMLVNSMGLLGVVLGTFISELFYVTSVFCLIFRNKIINDARYFFRKTFQYVIVSVMELIVVLYISNLFLNDYTIIVFIYRLILSCLIVIGCNILLFYRSEEIKYFKAVFLFAFKKILEKFNRL